jgi:hypothetical protein
MRPLYNQEAAMEFSVLDWKDSRSRYQETNWNLGSTDERIMRNALPLFAAAAFLRSSYSLINLL